VGCYRFSGRNDLGQVVGANGLEPVEALIAKCKEYAADISKKQ
jgi:hypothetical protein